ncbi:hypothetical protein ACFE04_011121 [Oxalis oulophora]
MAKKLLIANSQWLKETSDQNQRKAPKRHYGKSSRILVGDLYNSQVSRLTSSSFTMKENYSPVVQLVLIFFLAADHVPVFGGSKWTPPANFECLLLVTAAPNVVEILQSSAGERAETVRLNPYCDERENPCIRWKMNRWSHRNCGRGVLVSNVDK